ncbi:hypothetical protein Celaphus_00013706 [Cervus elaphus hippelaphus]|uniref:Calponin-homology (CH) domain-containing protein n=1 Tax=Cervus elaphus hippelaphus TaxID=46360 RepID=A0A212CDG2_CEREH|nr:hypothetical protein Celaphus_00013706 [Cervus elaphus hippelaphus]
MLEAGREGRWAGTSGSQADAPSLKKADRGGLQHGATCLPPTLLGCPAPPGPCESHGTPGILAPAGEAVTPVHPQVLIDWINDVLVEERIIVKQLEEDLYDGQVLQKLLEKLADCKLNVAEVTQSEIGQKQKLQTVLEAVQELLRPHSRPLQWNVDSIHGKNLVAILHLLVALAMHFRAPIHLPEHVSVQVVVVRVNDGAGTMALISREADSKA